MKDLEQGSYLPTFSLTVKLGVAYLAILNVRLGQSKAGIRSRAERDKRGCMLGLCEHFFSDLGGSAQCNVMAWHGMHALSSHG